MSDLDTEFGRAMENWATATYGVLREGSGLIRAPMSSEVRSAEFDRPAAVALNAMYEALAAQDADAALDSINGLRALAALLRRVAAELEEAGR